MEDLCFNGNSLKTSDPSIGQFLHHIENQSELTNQEKRAYAISHLSLSVKENLQCDGNGKWRDLRKFLFQKYRSRLTLKEKIVLQKSLIQHDEESVKEFFDRCMKSQYILHDDIEIMFGDNDVVFSFAIGLKDHIQQKLLFNENIHSLEECLKIALEIEDNFDLKDDEALAASLPMQLDVKATEIECKTNFSDYDSYMKEESLNLAKMNQDQEIVNDYEEEMFSDNENAKETDDPNDKTFQKSDSETSDKESDNSSEDRNDDKENENSASIITMEKSTKTKVSSMKNKEYRRKCTVCGNNFPSLKDLKKHMATDHKNNKLQCQLCFKYYKDRDGLRFHLKYKHNEKYEKTKICEQCPKTTFTCRRSDVAHSVHVGLYHPKLDSKDGTGKLMCQICDDSNEENFTPTELESHIRFIHYSEKYPTCEFCASKFVTPKELHKHQEVAHKEIKCDICGKEFKNKKGWYNTLTAHKKYEHGIGKLDLDCSVCKKSFKEKHHLTKHLTEVHGPKHFTCEQCGKSFATDLMLNVHKQVHMIKSIPCPVQLCGLKAATDMKLRQHIRNCHKKKKEKNIKCEECDQMFHIPYKLKFHVATVHRGEKPLKCDKCDFRCAYKNTLKQHKATIHEGVMYSCKVCGKQMNRISSINTHMKTFHQIPLPAELKPIRKRIQI